MGRLFWDFSGGTFWNGGPGMWQTDINPEQFAFKDLLKNISWNRIRIQGDDLHIFFDRKLVVSQLIEEQSIQQDFCQWYSMV